MPTVLACLRRSVERMWPRRVPTRFGPATRLRRPKNRWNQGPLATQQAEMCPRTANSGLTLALGLPSRALAGEAAPLLGRGGDELGPHGLERGADVPDHLLVALPAALLQHGGRGLDRGVGDHRVCSRGLWGGSGT